MLTTLLFIIVLICLVFWELVGNRVSQLILFTLSGLMAVGFYKNWLDLGKTILGLLIGFGSLTFGIVAYIILPHLSKDDGLRHEGRGFEIVIVGGLIGILLLLFALLYYYKFKEKQTPRLEKYFSYILFIGVTIAFSLTFCFSFNDF